jgi:hypothetical protein
MHEAEWMGLKLHLPAINKPLLEKAIMSEGKRRLVGMTLVTWNGQSLMLGLATKTAKFSYIKQVKL